MQNTLALQTELLLETLSVEFECCFSSITDPDAALPVELNC